MTIKKRPRLTIRKANGQKINTIENALNIEEDMVFGDVNTLKFDVPFYQINLNGNIIYDEDGFYKRNNKIDILLSENIVEIEDRVYIIKIPVERKDSDGLKFVSVSCEEMASDLAFKQVKYLNLLPPYSNPVDPKRAILEIITYPYQQDLGYGKFTSVSGTSLTLGLTTTFDFTGFYIAILDGTGKYQQRKIVSYNTTTKVAVVDSLFSPQVDTTSVFRIHNSRFLLGDVDNDIMIVDGTPVFRFLQFEDTTIQEALQTARARFSGSLTYQTTRSDTENRYFVTVGLKNNNGESGYEFRYKKNIRGISRVVDSTDSCYTRVFPEGRNNLSIVNVTDKSRTDSGTTYDSHTQGKGDIYNFQYYLGLGYTLDECYDLFVKDFRFIEDAYVDADDLYLGAEQALKDLSLPKIDYSIEGIDFSQLDLDIFKGISLPELRDGDIIKVVDTELGFNFKATIRRIRRNYNNPERPSIELTNFTDTIGDVLAKIIKYQEGYSNRKSLYGKSATIVIADKATSRNWRYADYVVPDDGSVPFNEILQFAIDEISAQNGGDIYIAEGDYGLTNQVNVKGGVNIYGYGTATRIYPVNFGVAGQPNLAFNISNVKSASINDLFIDFDRDSYAIDDTLGKHDYIFANGIGIYNGSDSISIKGCTINTVSNNVIIAIESSNISIDGNVIQSDPFVFTGTDVIDLKACTNANVFRNRIIGKIGGMRVINITNQVGISSGEFFVQDNYMLTTDNPSTWMEITVEQDAYVSVSDNTVITSGVDAYLIDGIRATAVRDFDIYNNTFHCTIQRYGLDIDGISGGIPSNGNVKNNNFNFVKQDGTSGDSVGIRLSFGAREVVVQNNKVTGTNIYDTVNTTALTYGCLIFSGCENNVVSGNDFSVNTTTSFLNNGVNTLILGGNKL